MTREFDTICVGAALVDMVAQVARHPKEDDEVFVSDLKILSGGAAANTAVSCSKLGLNTAFIGKLGLDDEFGTRILNDFEKSSVSTDFIKYSEKYNTGSAYVALNPGGDRRIYAYSGAANYLSAADIKEDELSKTSMIYLSSLKNIKPFYKASKIGKNHDIPVILNPGMLIIELGFKKIKSLFKLLDILILSENEFRSLLKIPSDKTFSKVLYEQSAKKLKKLGIKIIIITLGKKGALLIFNETSKVIKPMLCEKVIDTTGAGDAFSAGFMYEFHKNQSFNFKRLIKCIKLGNFVAGNCIQKLGARHGIPSLEEVRDFERSLNTKI